MTTFASPSETRGIAKVLSNKFSNFFSEKFADSKKVTNFATPIGNEDGSKKFFQKSSKIFSKKICRFKKSNYLCNPNRTTTKGWPSAGRLVFLAPNLKDH